MLSYFCQLIAVDVSIQGKDIAASGIGDDDVTFQVDYLCSFDEDGDCPCRSDEGCEVRRRNLSAGA